MMHMNKKHGIWDQIYCNMASGAKSLEMGMRDCAYFSFGLAAASLIHGIPGVPDRAMLDRLNKLREELAGARK